MNPTVETKGIKGKIKSMKAEIRVQAFEPNDLVTLKAFIMNLKNEFGVMGAATRLMGLGYFGNMAYIAAFEGAKGNLDAAMLEIPIKDNALLKGSAITTIAAINKRDFAATGTKIAAGDTHTPLIVQTIFGVLNEGQNDDLVTIIKFAIGTIDIQTVFAGRPGSWQQVNAVRGINAVAMAFSNDQLALGYHDNGGSKVAMANPENLTALWDGTASNEISQHHYIGNRRIRDFSHTHDGKFTASLHPSVQTREGIKYSSLDLDFGPSGIVSDGKMVELGAMIDYGRVMGMKTHRAMLDMNYGTDNERALKIGPQLMSANA